MTYLVANYNNGRYFGDVLASLEVQTDSRWRCLICDDASTDGSLAFVETRMRSSSAQERIRLLRNERNLGYAGTLKKLLAHAETDIVAILDADDALMPRATEMILQAYAQDPGAAFVYSKHADLDAALGSVQCVRGERVPEGSTSLTRGFVGHLWSFRRSLYDRTAGWDETMLYCEDRDLIYKLEELARPVFVDAVLYKRRVLPTSQSNDPAKRYKGKVNHIRARKNALCRRGIGGMRYCLTLLSYYVRDHPHPIMTLLLPLKWVLSKFDLPDA
ncbi:MAG: glycosyltransferase family 2 protein [Gemmatimonadota bacterium]